MPTDWMDNCNHEGIECETDRFGICNDNCVCVDCTNEDEDEDEESAASLPG